MTTPTAAIPLPARPSAIPLERSRSLFRWNAALSVLHFVQGAVILAISFAKSPLVTSPVVGRTSASTPPRRTWSPPSGRSGICRSGRGGAVLLHERDRPLHDGVPGPRLVRGSPRPWPEPHPLDRVRLQLERDDRGHRGAGRGAGDRHADRHLRRQRGHDHVRWSMEIANEGRDGPSGSTTSSAASSAPSRGSWSS